MILAYLSLAYCIAIIAAQANSSLPSLETDLSTQFNASNPLAVLSGAFPLLDASNPPSAALRIPPAWSFSIGLIPETFKPPSLPSKLYYWAVADDGLDLPNWLSFDNSSLTFFGVAPAEGLLANSSDTLHISLFCALVFGDNTSAASTSFTVQLSKNSLNLYRDILPLKSIAGDYLYAMYSSVVLGDLQIIGMPHISEPSTLHMDVNITGESWLIWNRYCPLVPGTTNDSDPLP